MYSKRYSGELHNRFWEAFGKYMAPVLSASGGRISWTHYQTALKGVFFRQYVTDSEVCISIEMPFSFGEKRLDYFTRFRVLKASLEHFLGEAWHWEEEAVNMNAEKVSRIFMRMENVNIHNENDWPAIISFLKPRLIALDRFWHEHFEYFELMG
jgi:hypothetical protein